MGPSTYLALIDMAALALCGIAAVIDLRTQRIPNWLTLSGALLGLALNFAIFSAIGGFRLGVWEGLGPAFAGGGAALVCAFFLGALGALGMGDVKLLAAAGAFLRFPASLWALVFALLAGGLLALGYSLARGKLRAVARNLRSLSRGDSSRTLHRIPYGPAIFAGCAAAIASRHFALGPFA